MTSTLRTSRTPIHDASPQESRVAIVTGASRGIGLELAKRLAKAGYRVVATARTATSTAALQSTANVKLVDGDIGERRSAERVIDTAIREFGRIDLLVNNAGIFVAKPFTGYTSADFQAISNTNLAGFFHVSQLAVAQMRVQKSGHVVNITASIATQPIAGLTASLATLTKGGLEAVVRALAIEFADEGIRFNAIAPGVVNTPMHSAEMHPFLEQLSPMKRLAEVHEVADALLFMDSAPFVNGEVVHLDGGAHAGRW